MAKLRKGISYSKKLERPYTRKSKKRKLNYVRASPNTHVVKFDMGDPNKPFSHKLTLKSKVDVQIRHNSLESGRKSSNRLLDKNIGNQAYRMKIKVYPHHILRENPMASGAGADRMSEGMKRAFGKPIGLAARVKKGQVILEIEVDKEHLDLGKDAIDRFRHKMPGSCTIEITEN